MLSMLLLAIVLATFAAYMFNDYMDTKPDLMHKRQIVDTTTISPAEISALMAAVPEYVQVSPDFVAFAPSSPYGLSGDALNNMVCLVNRYRYDNKQPALALHPKLIQYAQARAQTLFTDSATVSSNVVEGASTSTVKFNTTIWSNVKENLLQSQNNPTYAYWEFQDDTDAAANLLDASFDYFGAGYYNGYYVQAVGTPAEIPDIDSSLYPWCPANETFWDWVFPNEASDTFSSMPDISGQAFPFGDYDLDAPTFFKAYTSGEPDGMQSGYDYYFLEETSSIPYIESLAIRDTVAANTSSTPYKAIADAGVQGITKEELNLLVCLVNARRQESCLAPVALHAELIAAAQMHSYEMNRAENMTHYGPSGPLSMRVQRRGFDYSTLSENIVYNVFDVFTAHSLFCDSQPHLNNMLDPLATFVGGGRSGEFWTVTFGAYLDAANAPDVSTLPLCPGNSTDISIAFPNGLPTDVKTETAACSDTEAAPLPTPSYILTHIDSESSESSSAVDSDSLMYMDPSESESEEQPTSDDHSTHSHIVTIEPSEMHSKCEPATPTSNIIYIFGDEIISQSVYSERHSEHHSGMGSDSSTDDDESESSSHAKHESLSVYSEHHSGIGLDSPVDDDESESQSAAGSGKSTKSSMKGMTSHESSSEEASIAHAKLHDDDDDDNDCTDKKHKTSSSKSHSTTSSSGKHKVSSTKTTSSSGKHKVSSSETTPTTTPTPTTTHESDESSQKKWFSTTLTDTGKPNYPGDGCIYHSEHSKTISYAQTTTATLYILDANGNIDVAALESEYSTYSEIVLPSSVVFDLVLMPSTDG